MLAFDTATPSTVVALSLGDGESPGMRGELPGARGESPGARGERPGSRGELAALGEPLEARDDPPVGERPGHATRLLPLAADLLARAGIGWGELERIAVGVGPGTFTGLRVGLATAHGLAQSRGVPLVGVSSLRALALGAASGERRVLAAIDARRGEIFLAGYQGGVQLLPPVPVAPAALGELLADRGWLPAGGDDRLASGGGGWLAVGDGAVRYREAFAAAGATVPDDDSALHRIRAPALCWLASVAPVGDAPLLPDYLRRPDATPPDKPPGADSAAPSGKRHATPPLTGLAARGPAD